MDHWIVANCLWERRGTYGIPRDDSFWTKTPEELVAAGEFNSNFAPEEAPFMALVWSQRWAFLSGTPHCIWFAPNVTELDKWLKQVESPYSYILYEKVL